MKPITVLFFVITMNVSAQRPFGHEGAIPYDSSALLWWATSCNINRGFIDITNESLGYATLGNNSDALGAAKQNGVVSLGDGGWATLQFNGDIYNGEGADFVVFENGFPVVGGGDSLFFLELGFVEVSSDGIRFVRFPAVSMLDTLLQKENGSGSNPLNLKNLAGNYIYGYGTPFDLADLKDSALIDINKISHIRVVDVVGSLHNAYSRYDSKGNKINDPWPTPFPSGGFDLDAVGIIHGRNMQAIAERASPVRAIYPNPAKPGESILVELAMPCETSLTLSDVSGKKMLEFIPHGMQPEINLEGLQPGVYFLGAEGSKGHWAKKIIIE